MSASNDRINQYLDALRGDVIAAAEAKLGRTLSPEEKAGVQSVNGGGMLNSCYQSFSHAITTPDEVARGLAFFADQL